MWDSARRHGRAQLRLERGLPPVPDTFTEGPIPLSVTQARLWHRECATAAGRFANNVTAPVALLGPLDRAALEQAVARVVARHEALRMAFRDTAAGPMQTATGAVAGRFAYENCGGDPDAVDRSLAAAVTARFDLAVGEPFRVLVVRRATDDHVMLLVGHHLVLDGRSVNVLLVELAGHYTELVSGGPPRRSRPAVQLGQFVRWQRGWLASPAVEPYERHWAEVLAQPAFRRFGAHPFGRPPGGDPTGGRVERRLPAEVTERVSRLAAAEHVSPIAVYLAAYQAVMQMHLGGRHVVTGVPAVNRGRAELVDVVGLLANVLPVAAEEPARDTLRAAVHRAEEGVAGAYVHQAMPIEHLARRAIPRLDPAESPIDTFFAAYRQAVAEPVVMAGLELGPWPPLRTKDAESPALMTVLVEDDGATAQFAYGGWAMREAAAGDLLAAYVMLVDAATRDPDVALGRLLDRMAAR